LTEVQSAQVPNGYQSPQIDKEGQEEPEGQLENLVKLNHYICVNQKCILGKLSLPVFQLWDEVIKTKFTTSLEFTTFVEEKFQCLICMVGSSLYVI
jgi:hypothetical protein